MGTLESIHTECNLYCPPIFFTGEARTWILEVLIWEENEGVRPVGHYGARMIMSCERVQPEHCEAAREFLMPLVELVVKELVQRAPEWYPNAIGDKPGENESPR